MPVCVSFLLKTGETLGKNNSKFCCVPRAHIPPTASASSSPPSREGLQGVELQVASSACHLNACVNAAAREPAHTRGTCPPAHEHACCTVCARGQAGRWCLMRQSFSSGMGGREGSGDGWWGWFHSTVNALNLTKSYI